MDQIFNPEVAAGMMGDSMNTPVEAVGTDAKKKEAKKQAKEAKAKAYRQALDATISQDPDFLSKVFTLSDTVEVVKTLATVSASGLIHNKAGDKTDPKTGKIVKDLKPVPLIIGYIFKNVGNAPLSYTTAVWTAGPDGKYVSEVVERVAKPGEEFQLTRQYAAMLVTQPEFSFKIANGTFVESSKKIDISAGEEITADVLKARLEAYYFKFNDASISVNSDAVKIIIDKKLDDNKFEVAPKFVETFGYINNGVEKEAGARGSRGGSSIDPQVFAANYLNNIIKKNMGKM